MKIIIVGVYAIGTHLAELLSRNNEDVVLIDNNQTSTYLLFVQNQPALRP